MKILSKVVITWKFLYCDFPTDIINKIRLKISSLSLEYNSSFSFQKAPFQLSLRLQHRHGFLKCFLENFTTITDFKKSFMWSSPPGFN